MADPSPPGASTDQRLARALGPQYNVRGLVGRGGFAEVYEVFDVELERRLAVKVLRPDIAWTAGMLERFKHEARAVARLNHANILPIHFVGEGEGLVYYAMPYVQGTSLGHLLRGGDPMDPVRATGIVRPVLEALDHAHTHGLVHRDIKPENVMIEGSGRVLLVDFGIAKRMDAERGLTQTGFVVGTPHYMSPEQALGQPNVDARSDLYAVGAVLFQMVTGAPPFDGDTSQEIVGKHLAEPPPVPTTRNAKVPAWLSDVIVRCLQKKPDDRYPSASAVVAALASGEAGGSTAPVTAARIATQVAEAGTADAEAETAIVPSGERTRVSRPAPTSGPGPAPPSSARAGRRRRVWPWLVVAGVALAGLVLAAVLTRPTLEFHNRLMEPVRLTAGGHQRVVPAGGAFRSRLPRRAITLQWAVVQPQNERGMPMGLALRGSMNVEHPRGHIVWQADATTDSNQVFAPLVTNETGRPLTAFVNAGLQGAMPCHCVIRPGAVRQMIGYYPLFKNSTVRVEDLRRRTATFTDFASHVDRASGTVGLRFTRRDLR